MNTQNNRRRRDSQERIEKVFVNLIQTKEIKDIAVSDLCKLADVNRSTFYANYIDIYDLVEKITLKMKDDFFEIYKEEVESKEHSYNFLKLFHNIKDNQLFYKTYFKLNMNMDDAFTDMNMNEQMMRFFKSTKYMDYHIAFFKAGLNAILQKWLENGCQETPEEINEIIVNEYSKRIDLW